MTTGDAKFATTSKTGLMMNPNGLPAARSSVTWISSAQPSPIWFKIASAATAPGVTVYLATKILATSCNVKSRQCVSISLSEFLCVSIATTLCSADSHTNHTPVTELKCTLNFLCTCFLEGNRTCNQRGAAFLYRHVFAIRTVAEMDPQISDC